MVGKPNFPDDVDTRGDLKGRHYHPTIAVWDASFRGNFARRFMLAYQATLLLERWLLLPFNRTS